MNTNISGRKLILNKKTISNLNDKEMEGIKGGIVSYFQQSGCVLCCIQSITTCNSTQATMLTDCIC